MTTHALPKRNSGVVLSVRAVMWGSVALALLAALSYLLADWGLLSLGDLTPEEGPAFIIYVTTEDRFLL